VPQGSGLEFPHHKRVTVSLAPHDLVKEPGRFDLPIAPGMIDASTLGERRPLARGAPLGLADVRGQSAAKRATARLGRSARSFHRIPRVAPTIADLVASAAIATPQLAEAIQYRRALGSAEAGRRC
jgi:predicted ATPase with chaperone activity